MKPRARRSRSWLRLLAIDTELWDSDALWELPPKERKRVKSAMIWGRPLPPALAGAAVEHAAKMQTQSWYGRFVLTMAALFAALAVSFGLLGGKPWWASLGWGAAAVCWLVVGVGWLRAVARAKRAVRDGHWPAGVS